MSTVHLHLADGRVGDRRQIRIESRYKSDNTDKNPASATMLVYDHAETMWTAGTADAGGSTTEIVDAARTEADDFWNGIPVEVKHADGSTETSEVSDYDKTTYTLTIGALESAVAAGDTYKIMGYPVLAQGACTVSGNEVYRLGTPTDVFSRDRLLTVITRFTFPSDDIQECVGLLNVLRSAP